MTARNALIVGAGIGGLAAAIALRHAGWNVRVFERAASPRELGFALIMAPNAMHALGALGLAERVRQGGFVMTSGEWRRPDGRILRRLDTQSTRELLDEDTVCILRPVLHGALLDVVGTAALELAAEAAHFSATGAGVELRLSDGRSIRGDVLIGADGVGSLIRRQLHPHEAPARPSGLLAVRGVAGDVVEHLAGISGAQYFGRGFEAGVARASDGDVYWYMSVHAKDVPRPREAPTVAARFASGFHDPFRAIVAATHGDGLRLDELLERDPIDDWGRGPVTLLGDAAHPMLPHTGQGAAQALEDAVALGAVLRDAFDPASIDAALRHYERVRAARTRSVAEIARRNARIGSMRSAFGCWLRDQTIRFIPQSLILKSLVALGTPPEITSVPTA